MKFTPETYIIGPASRTFVAVGPNNVQYTILHRVVAKRFEIANDDALMDLELEFDKMKPQELVKE